MEQDKTSPRIWHVVAEHGTTTFLDHGALMEFLGPTSIEELNKHFVVCESEVTGEEYDRLSRWRGAIS